MSRRWNVRSMISSDDPKDQCAGYYYEKMARIGTSVYEWTDEPMGRLIERYCWRDGRAMIWNSPELGIVVTGCSERSWNINGDANRWQPEFDSEIAGLSKPILGVDECAVIYDLPDHFMRRSDCLYLCKQIADVNDTIRTQVSNQKTPMVAYASNRKMASKIRNAIVEIASGVKALILDTDMRDQIQVLDFNAPYNVETLQQYLWSLESEMLEYLGVDSQDAFQKKERLVVDEQEGNDELLNYLLASGLKSRRIGCDHANDLFNLGLDVNVQGLIRPLQGMEEDTPLDQGGDENAD